MKSHQILSKTIAAFLDSYREVSSSRTAWLKTAVLSDPRLKTDPVLSRGDELPLLRLANETAFSDWLGWCLAKNGDKESLGNKLSCLFGDEFANGQAFFTQREAFVEQGHDAQSGRLDLFLSQPSLKRFQVIEVKTRNPSREELQKNNGYRDSIKKSHPDFVGSFALLVPNRETSELSEDYEGYRVIEWSEIAGALRKTFQQTSLINQYEKALIASFICAIEGNVLQFSVDTLRAIIQGAGNGKDEKILDYEYCEYLERIYGS